MERRVWVFSLVSFFVGWADMYIFEVCSLGGSYL